MKEIFLSASVPERGRQNFDETSDPFLIQFAVRELISLCLGRRRVIWGGHPSITPMVHAVCQDYGLEVEAPVLLFQSTYYRDRFPTSNRFFKPELVEGIAGNEAKSLAALRKQMLTRRIEAAVFIGGMEGILDEFRMYREIHGPKAIVLALGAPGGAARQLAEELGPAGARDRIDFVRLYQEVLQIDPAEPRQFARSAGSS